MNPYCRVGPEPNVTDALIYFKKAMCRDRDTGRTPSEDRSREGSDISIRQRTKISSKPPEARREACDHLQKESALPKPSFVPFRTMEKGISVA